jgi:2-polyprenyl-3-methyl-5-hydroxy-6-metoxy-1,4-benzoquinol methylase
MKYYDCPLCSFDEYKTVFSRPDHTHGVTDEIFNVVKCQRCGLVFINPRPTEEEISNYYPAEFYDTEISPELLLKSKKNVLEGKFKFIENLEPGRLLDIGCQKGEFLYYAANRGWDVQGVDFSNLPPNLFNMPIFYGLLEDAPFADNSFDVITLWAVLEHLHDPVQMLNNVCRLLKPGGSVYILVPNFNSIPGRFLRQDDIPRHLIMFTKRTFELAAEKAGLKTNKFVFSDNIFSGSTRGTFNYIWKLLNGEPHEDIVAQNRTHSRWEEFSNCVNGKKSSVMLKIDRFDIIATKYLDYIVNALGFGFIMTVECVRGDK